MRASLGSNSLEQVNHGFVPAREINPYGAEHAYAQVANDVERRIRTGEITRKLPAERDLAEEYGVSYVTVRHAMQILRERDLIITVHGRGTFVKEGSSPQG